MPTGPAFRRWRQKDFKIILGYIVKLRSGWATCDPASRIKQTKILANQKVLSYAESIVFSDDEKILYFYAKLKQTKSPPSSVPVPYPNNVTPSFRYKLVVLNF